jgi:AMIN domain
MEIWTLERYMKRPDIVTIESHISFEELNSTFLNHTSCLMHAILVFCFVLFLLSAASAQELENPLITNVQIAPDQKQLIIKADKALGTHSAFAFENPYRLVIDFESTGLGKVPAKIKVDKPPINEIRLGKNGHRARIVVDFGEYPVPPFMVERNGNLAVVALGAVPTDPRMLQRSPQAESGSKPRSVSPPQPQRHAAPKNDQTRVPAPLPIDKPTSTPINSGKKNEQTSFVVKQSLVTNNLLLVELQNRKSPAETYRVVVDLNLNSMTIRNASISNSSGVVKKFDLLESGPKISKGDEDSKENPDAPALVGPRKEPASSQEKTNDGRKYSWGAETNPSEKVTLPRQETPPTNPFRLQKFELKNKNSGSAKLDD